MRATSSHSCKTPDFHTLTELGAGSSLVPPLTSSPAPQACPSPRSLCLGPGPSAAPGIPFALDSGPWLGLLAGAAAALLFPLRAWQRGECLFSSRGPGGRPGPAVQKRGEGRAV